VQFVNLVKGEYGATPVPVDAAFREKITGSPVETNYDTSKHRMQDNPALEQFGGVKLAENEKEVLLLELFPQVAKEYLTRTKGERWAAGEAERKAASPSADEARKVEVEELPITGHTVDTPLPGKVLEFLVKPGDKVKIGQDVFILEAMKMENSIAAENDGTVKRLLASTGDIVASGAPIVELE
jgi:biotin carboxyl carrier protein